MGGLMTVSLAHVPTAELLRQFSAILTELKRRRVVRSMNNPVADLAEGMAAAALGGTLAPGSERDYDVAVRKGDQTIRYQVKARRLNADNQSRQLGALRGMDQKGFDFLVGMLFAEDFTPIRGAVIPWEIVKARSTYRAHTNAWVFHLRDDVWSVPGVADLVLPRRQAARIERSRNVAGARETGTTYKTTKRQPSSK
jgi:hypothetical protein